MDAAELIADLDPDQRAAVITESSLVAVVAGAGSGKTRVLTRRIAHRIATGSADANHTLALTFTREAAGELRRRLHRLGIREHVEAGTFHSVMLRILKQRWTDTDRRPKTVVSDRRRLLADAQTALDLNAARGVMNAAIDEIGWAMARGITHERYEATARRDQRRPAGGVEAMSEIYAAYTVTKRRRGVLDFDDVLLDVLDEARRDPEFADVLRWRFRHLLVDEAQDLNPVQHRIVDLLRSGRDDLFLVGDPSQAVYGFNGADPTLLVDVERRFPGVEVIRLPLNHRCTPQVVAVGVHVLESGGQPTDVKSARDDGPTASVLVAADESSEAVAVASRLATADPSIVRSGQVAVLARTNAQLTAFERAITDAGLTVRRSATASGSPLQAAVRDASTATSASALRAWAHDTLDDIDALERARHDVDEMERRRSVAARTTRSADGGRPTNIAPHAAQFAEVRSRLARVEAERRVAASLLDFLRDQPRADGAEFRQWVATTNPFDDRSTDGVDLLSFHAAKGREWHTVYVSGVETSLVPHKSASTTSEKAEEARLLYVACTRATDVLVLTRAERRGGYARKPSPLIETLDVAPPPITTPPARPRRRDPVGELHARLVEWRAETAARARIVPDQLLSDRDLSSIASAQPTSAAELNAATSIGMITATRLADEICPLVVDALD
ncbi:MAG: ATP-dependent helicase [Ilumatobacter sp.]